MSNPLQLGAHLKKPLQCKGFFVGVGMEFEPNGCMGRS